MPAETELNLSYKSRYPSRAPPEAYARLILDVLRGDQAQFVRSDELAAAWAIFTPILHAIDSGAHAALRPVVYPYGSRGPTQSDRLIQRYGYVYEGRYAGAYRAQHNGPAAVERALDAVRAEFALPRERLQRLIVDFVGEMHRGLRGEPGASIKMIPSYVTALPTGAEAGSFWAIDMGGSNLRVMETVLSGGGAMAVGREHKVVIPVAAMTGSAAGLFDFVADAMLAAGVPAGAVVGFTFSFPVNQTAVDAGSLLEWTKGFSATGVVGTDVMGLLEAACGRKGLAVRLTALVNDTVGTLLACAYGDTAARMGVILGTGTNAAYRECAARGWGGGGSEEPLQAQAGDPCLCWQRRSPGSGCCLCRPRHAQCFQEVGSPSMRWPVCPSPLPTTASPRVQSSACPTSPSGWARHRPRRARAWSSTWSGAASARVSWSVCERGILRAAGGK